MTTQNKSVVSAVILNWNGSNFLSDGIDSLRRQTYHPLEIIVIDQASEDGSKEWLASQSGIHLIRNTTNTGYCGGANQGIAIAKGDWTLIINHDVILQPNYIEILMRHADALPDVGMLSGLLLNKADKDDNADEDDIKIDSAGQELSKALIPRERGYQQSLKKYPEAEREGYIFSVCGALACYRTSMLKKLGENGGKGNKGKQEGPFDSAQSRPFDETFFAYSEDLDIGWRAQTHGWKAYHVPSARAFHARGAVFENVRHSSFVNRHWKIFNKPDWLKIHIIRNRYLVLLKNCPFSIFLKQLPWILLRDFPLLMLFLVAKPNLLRKVFVDSTSWQHAKTYRRRHRPSSRIPYDVWIN